MWQVVKIVGLSRDSLINYEKNILPFCLCHCTAIGSTNNSRQVRPMISNHRYAVTQLHVITRHRAKTYPCSNLDGSDMTKQRVTQHARKRKQTEKLTRCTVHVRFSCRQNVTRCNSLLFEQILGNALRRNLTCIAFCI